MKADFFLKLFAALSGFLGVVLGALAAHKAHDPYAASLLMQASYYDLIHSVAIIALYPKTEKAARLACGLFVVGIVLFCGGLAFKGLTGVSFGPLIPCGGGSLMLGWLALLFLRKS